MVFSRLSTLNITKKTFVDLQLLATVLSQSAKAKEHLLEQTKSMDQPGKTVTPAEGHHSSVQTFHSRMFIQTRLI